MDCAEHFLLQKKYALFLIVLGTLIVLGLEPSFEILTKNWKNEPLFYIFAGAYALPLPPIILGFIVLHNPLKKNIFLNIFLFSIRWIIRF